MAADDDSRDSESTSSNSSKKKKSPFLFIVIVALVVLVAAGAALYFLVLKKPAGVVDPANPGQTTQATAPQAANAEPGPMQAYPPFVVNLADPGGSRYLKVTLSLELSKDKNFAVEVEAKSPKIKDIIISILSSKTYDEISTSQGKVALKQEIIRRLNTIMSTGRVMDVYITEFMIQ